MLPVNRSCFQSRELFTCVSCLHFGSLGLAQPSRSGSRVPAMAPWMTGLRAPGFGHSACWDWKPLPRNHLTLPEFTEGPPELSYTQVALGVPLV